MLKGIKKTAFNIIIVSCVIVAMLACSIFAVSFSSIFYIIICGVIGLSVYLVSLIKRKGGEGK